MIYWALAFHIGWVGGKNPVELDNYPPYWITNINKKQLQNIDKKDHILSHK
jgi:hypothetical protein